MSLSNMENLMNDIVANVLSGLAICITLIGIFIGNSLQKKRERYMLNKEIRDKQLLEDSKNCSETIKIIANDFSYFMEKTRMMVLNKNASILNTTDYKIEVLTMQHDLNEKLLKFRELIERLEFENKNDYNIFSQFYSYIYSTMNDRYNETERFFDEMEVNKAVPSSNLKTFYADSSLLNLAINTATENYKKQLNKE